jgi:2-methylcitrate dehydratase PrpD
MLRLNEDQVRWVLSLAMQQASGSWIWKRDTEHVEKAFDFMGMGSRNGVMAATMVAAGLRGVDDAFAGNDNFFSALADEASPEKLVADLGKNTGVLGTAIKKYTVGGGCQSVLDSTSNLLANAAVRADNIKTINVQMPPNILKIFDNNPVSDLCVQHLVAMMIIDKGVTFKSVHDEARMQDPKILAVRKLVELTPNPDLGKPPQQAIVTIGTADGQTFTDHTTYVRGSPKNPMDASEVSAKARDLINPILGPGRSDDLIKAILDLEHFGPLSGLRKLVQA